MDESYGKLNNTERQEVTRKKYQEMLDKAKQDIRNELTRNDIEAVVICMMTRTGDQFFTSTFGAGHPDMQFEAAVHLIRTVK